MIQQEGVNGKVFGVLGDLKKPETMAEVVDKANTAMGGIDILVCSGGNGYSEYLGLDVKDPESYRMMQDVAVLSPMFLAEAAFPFLSKSTNKNGGTVVVVGSVSANVAWPNTAPHNFAMASKNTMTQTLAFKYRNDNIRVNGVQAGVIHTGALDVMAVKKNRSVESYAALRASAQPLGRCGTPEDVANAVVYLASPASGFTTGELLRVDGGLHLSNWWNQQTMLNEYKGGDTK
ncbi:NAD(P)-binding protein [Fragilariopsis cylindrus CCMP1102]|uniref:NAD(P)-binding protein n=1 Tax=Fragilariopsis cylindrus CCMP1102 TaxID=635003 RepID=A0A1E7FB96_9STRA|nr:NAD(P)-binding protein [Fragilariopsis cylindrus CCMP1102]|eukprot:OEU15448.1 NAD(P)-binding protein [Fragilariopsis cylindrus CCMP1102]